MGLRAELKTECFSIRWNRISYSPTTFPKTHKARQSACQYQAVRRPKCEKIWCLRRHQAKPYYCTRVVPTANEAQVRALPNHLKSLESWEAHSKFKIEKWAEGKLLKIEGSFNPIARCLIKIGSRCFYSNHHLHQGSLPL